MSEPTLEGLRQQERSQRRELILSAARRLFSVKDFRKVTSRQIAKAAGVSIGTVFNYYASLDELFLDIFLKNAEAVVRRIDAGAAGGAPGFKALCIDYVAFLNDNMTFYQMMGSFMLGGDLSPEAAERLNRLMRALMDRIEASMQAAGIRDESRLKAHALFSALNGLMISYARYPGRTPDDIRKHTLRLAGVIADAFLGSFSDLENAPPAAVRGRAGTSSGGQGVEPAARGGGGEEFRPVGGSRKR